MLQSFAAFTRLVLRSAFLFALSTTVGSAREPAEDRAPVPDNARQRVIRQQLEETVDLSKATTTPRKRKALADLETLAADEGTPPDERYVMLDAAVRLGQELGDYDAVKTASAALVESFDLDSLATATGHFLAFVATTKSGTGLAAATQELLRIVEQRAARNEYAEARRLLDESETHANRLNARSVLTAIAKTRAKVVERERAYGVFTRSTARLEQSPDDAAANWGVGTWWVVYEENWEKGLPGLSRGEQPEWRAAARAELVGGEGAKATLGIADAWWDAAQAVEGPARTAALSHAADWYGALDPDALSQLVKLRVQRRTAELTSILKRPVVFRGATASKAPTAPLPLGKPIDLLSMVDFPEHVVTGSWKRQGKEAVCAPTFFSRFVTPVAVRGAYEVTLRFTRQELVEAVQLHLPVGETACNVSVDSFSARFSGLDLVDGKLLLHAVGTPACHAPGRPMITNGKAHTLKVTVTPAGESATVRATLDGESFLDWTGEMSRLTVASHNAMPNPRAIGVLVFNNRSTIHELTLRIDSGEGYRLAADWKNPLTVVADRPEPGTAARCVQWNGRSYYFSTEKMLYGEAQALAKSLKGRLLTVSSDDEAAMLVKLNRGSPVWTAGWCSASRKWRDERNRPLRYTGQWGAGEPSNAFPEEGGQIFMMASVSDGKVVWDDAFPRQSAFACVEWGEEYDAE